MKTLKNIKKSYLEIATLLAGDETLCRLLLNDVEDALTIEAPKHDVNTLIQNNYISIFPPVENRIEEYDRNTFLSILVDNIMLTGNDENIPTGIVLYASTDEGHLLLKNNLNRLLEICDRILQVLEGQKLSSSGKISITSITHVMLSELHPAYRINIRFIDQPNRKEDI